MGEYSIKDKVAVAGLGETKYYKRGQAPVSEFQLACEAILKAVEDAGIKVTDLDGFASYSNDRNDAARLATALGLPHYAWASMVWGGGGGGGSGAVAQAAAAVAAGYAKYVVVFRALAQGQFGRFGQAAPVDTVSGPAAYAWPYGLFVRAVMYGRPLTREQYDRSRWIVEPFHLYDCCMENDGAAALVLTSAERARDLEQKPVYVMAAAQGAPHRAAAAAENSPDYASSHFRTLAPRLYQMAEIGPKDVDVVQIYEHFSGAVPISLVEHGFCEPDGVMELCRLENFIAPNGKLPLNTSGGNIAECYMHGLELVNEAVRQCRGTSTAQVPDAKIALVASGPMVSPVSDLILRG